MNKADQDLTRRRRDMEKRVMRWLGQDATRSQAKLAKAASMSTASLSTFLSGTYKAASDRSIIDRLESFFKLEDQRIDLLPDPEFIETRQSKRIRNFISMIHISRGIGILIGSSGIGKTMTVEDYMRDNPSVYYIPVNPMIRSKTQFFLNLAWTVLGKISVNNGGMVFDEIAMKVSAQGGMIIIDDAHLLYTEKSSNDSPFEIIRTLNDRGIAFIVAGNESLRDKVTQTNKAEFYQQLASRSKIQQIPHTFIEADIRSVIDSVLQDKPYTDEVFQYLYDMANKFYGSLRVMVNTLQLASFNANSRNEQVMRSHLETAASHVISVLKPEAKTKPKGKRYVQKTGNQNQEPVDTEKEPASLAS